MSSSSSYSTRATCAVAGAGLGVALVVTGAAFGVESSETGFCAAAAGFASASLGFGVVFCGQDVANAQRYVLNIADALVAVDPAGAAVYRANAERYTGQLKALDAEIRATLGSLPASQRKVVSSHDAFGYFARAYGIRFLAPVGVSNNAEPTAQGVAQLIRQVRAEKVPAVFLENIADPRLIERIRSESGARVGGTLYSDALSAADGAAPDYLAMMRHNLKHLREALPPR